MKFEETNKLRLRTQEHRDERYHEVPEMNRKTPNPHFPSIEIRVRGPAEDSEIATITSLI